MFEFESIVFGGANGFGESILLKFGEEEYGIIDSYINPLTKRPQVLDYIEENSIDPNQIKFVVLTHYHQDHFSGLAEILSLCTKAKFYCTEILTIKSFQVLIMALSEIDSPHNYFKEYIALFRVLKESNRKVLTLSNSSKPIVAKDDLEIYSLSPNKATELFFDPILKERTQKVIESPNLVIEQGRDFNFQSVVIIVKYKEFSFLYGADLEYHDKNNQIGWEALIKEERFLENKYDLFKVPHHGSENGCNENDWAIFLKPSTILKLTPYSRGRKQLPSFEMVSIIRNFSKKSYITSTLKYKKLPSDLKKRLSHLDFKRIANSTGFIRTVCKEGNLDLELAGDAYCLDRLETDN